ncbi:MAG TPA: hypothetical protein VHQ65_07345 [Thermoanaerobaculia bacterium]|nr:hypothetical protein [Thermoanaerobaculia bacterium]
MTRLGDAAAALGKGLVSGAVGTAVMTVAQSVEMKATGREPSTTPLEAARKTLGIEPADEAAAQRLNQMVHWAYGTQWGLARAVLGAFGWPAPAAAAGHFALIWGAALVMLPALGLAPPPREWGREGLAKDAGFHLLYAISASVTYAYLERNGR